MAHIYLWGFIFGTVKFLFSHWGIYAMATGLGLEVTFFDLFIPITSGALITLSVFYFFSDYLMDRAAKKRRWKEKQAIEKGLPFTPKKKFTFMNKLMVKLKRMFGIYGITLLAPLFLSIPLGAIVCAKFYGHQKKTFPLMLTVVISYSTLMCSLIYLVN